MGDDVFEQAVQDLKRAAKELATASAQLSQRVLTSASDAAKDPKGTAHKAAQTAARELDSAAKEIERILGHL